MPTKMGDWLIYPQICTMYKKSCKWTGSSIGRHSIWMTLIKEKICRQRWQWSQYWCISGTAVVSLTVRQCALTDRSRNWKFYTLQSHFLSLVFFFSSRWSFFFFFFHSIVLIPSNYSDVVTSIFRIFHYHLKSGRKKKKKKLPLLLFDEM